VIEHKIAAAQRIAEQEHSDGYAGKVDLWRPFFRIFSKKLRKRYHPDATPVDLLLYYGPGRQPSFWPLLSPYVEQQRVERGRFGAVWVDDAQWNIVLERFVQGQTPYVCSDWP
jgi:hypothetical protein